MKTGGALLKRLILLILTLCLLSGLCACEEEPLPEGYRPGDLVL